MIATRNSNKGIFKFHCYHVYADESKANKLAINPVVELLTRKPTMCNSMMWSEAVIMEQFVLLPTK
jgi:hypothetical protein